MPRLARVRKVSRWWSHAYVCLLYRLVFAIAKLWWTVEGRGGSWKNMKLCESTKHMAEGPIWHMCYEEAKPVQKILTENYQLLNARSLQETQQTAMPKIHQKSSKVIQTTKDFQIRVPRCQENNGPLELFLVILTCNWSTCSCKDWLPIASHDCFTRQRHTIISLPWWFSKGLLNCCIAVLFCWVFASKGR